MNMNTKRYSEEKTPGVSILITDNGTELLAYPEPSSPNSEIEPSSHDHSWDLKVLMSFSREPLSDAAKNLTEYVMGLVGRKPRVGRKLSKSQRMGLDKAVGAFLGDLCSSINDGSISEVGCPKSSNAFTSLPIGYKSCRSVYDTLMTHGLIEVVVKGSWMRDIYEQGKVERIRATEAFVELVRSYGIEEGTTRQHFPSMAKPKALQLRKGSQWAYGSKVRGKRMSIDESDPTVQRLATQVEELNNFMSETVSIEGAEFTGWTRIFNEGDDPTFNWDRGGRLYASALDQSYQSLSKKDRLAIRLNGEPVTEIDVRASHLTILYGLRMPEGQIFDAAPVWAETLDPYIIPGVPRAVVKAWVTITLGKGKAPTRWPKEASERLTEEGIDVTSYPLKAVQALILACHPVLGELDDLGWAQLQWLESEAIIATMQKLQRQGIPSLPVHDSLIVPDRHKDLAKEAMIQKYSEHCFSKPIVT